MHAAAAATANAACFLLFQVIKIKKFAYGACEMVFNPFKLWPTDGPFNKSFRTYITNRNIAWHQKTSMLAYLSSYLVRTGNTGV